jgi:hypothetical protein
VTVLGDRCFYGCSNLTEVTILSSVTVLSENCFNECANLTDVVLPKTLKEIGMRAFAR